MSIKVIVKVPKGIYCNNANGCSFLNYNGDCFLFNKDIEVSEEQEKIRYLKCSACLKVNQQK